MAPLLLLLLAHPALDDAERALAEFDAKAALTALERAKASGPLELDDHIRFHEYSGVALAYLERKDESLAAFSELLALDPGHLIPYTLSPQVTFIFQEARRNAGPTPAVDFSWPRDLDVGQRLPVVVEVLRDPRSRYAYAQLFWRSDPARGFQAERVELAKPGAYVTVELPADLDASSDQTRQLFLSAYDIKGNEISRLGSAVAPREVTMRYVAPSPWYEKWWIWASVGAAVAAGTAAAVYAGTRPEPEDIDFGVSVP